MRMHWMKICIAAATLAATASWSQAQQPASPASINLLLVEAGRLIQVDADTPGSDNTDAYDRATPTSGAENTSLPKDPGKLLAIYQIQGAGHTSPHLNVKAQTSGIVTAVATNGFYLQDPTGDGDDSTSDGIFVFTRSAPGVNVGDSVTVTGTVAEYTPGGESTDNLSVTQISSSPTITVMSSDNSLPPPIMVGAAGRQPPTQIIDDDSLTLFDPASDGIDFYESLECMRVTIAVAQAVAPTSRYGKIFTVADHGADTTGLNRRGGLTIAADDFNPERLQINNTLLPESMPMPLVNTGDTLGDVTGVVSYSFGNFEVLPTTTPTVTSGSIARESTALSGGDDHLLIAAYNVLNLDPNDEDRDKDVADGRFAAIAVQIVNDLNKPDIIALQEVQDNSGSTNDGTTAADQTLQALIDAIVSAGGPTYSFIDNPPADNKDGGEDGGNIRVAFLYNATRVLLIDTSRLEDNDGNDAFVDARKSLQATFEFSGERIILINNHFSSKRDSSPLFGKRQPPINGRLKERKMQATFVNAHVDGLLDADPQAKIVVLGDLNEFQFEMPLAILEGNSGNGSQVLFNLGAGLSATERYSYIYEGNSQKLDHILVSRALWDLKPQYDVVHLNCEFSDAPSDHDPQVARLRLKR